jgi:hypothetical protein
MPDLQPHEVTRLLACSRALAADPPKVRAALKKLADVPPASKAALVASAIEAVLADGRVLPNEVRFLEALHAALGLPLNALYSALHRTGEDHGPVEVLRSECLDRRRQAGTHPRRDDAGVRDARGDLRGG